MERMLCSSTLGFPKSSPLVQLMEYGTSTFSGYRGSRTAEGLPPTIYVALIALWRTFQTGSGQSVPCATWKAGQCLESPAR